MSISEEDALEEGRTFSSETTGEEFNPVLAFTIATASEESSEEGDWKDSRFEIPLNWTGLNTCSGDDEPEATGDVFADR